MQVYTFSTGGCRDGIYLTSLSLTKEGVKELIISSGYLYLDNSQSVQDIYFTDDEEILVSIYDKDIDKVRTVVYELIVFSVS